MNAFFFDGSALVKRFAAEPGQALVDSLFARVGRERLMCLMLGVAEVAAALIRKRNGGIITPTTYATAMADPRAEILNSADFAKLASDNSVVNSSISLLEKHPINATDAIVLYVVLQATAQLRADGDDLVLVCSDRRLLRAAQAEGLLTFDPESQTQAELDALIGP